MTSSAHLAVTEMPGTVADVVRTHARARGRRPMIADGRRTITDAGMDACSSRGGKLNAVNVAVNWRLAPAEMAVIREGPRRGE